jgi:hypothetical protein
MLVILAVFALWMEGWLFWVAEQVEGSIPAWQSVSLWTALWAIVLAASVAAAVTGRDMPARIAFGAMAMVSTGAAVTIGMSHSMSTRFYAFGMAVVWAGASFVLLLAPLQRVPKEAPNIVGES